MRVSNVGAYNIRIYKRVSTFVLFLPRKHKRVFMLFLVSARNTNAFLSHSFSQPSNRLKQLEPFRFLSSKGVFQCTVSARLYKEKFLFAFLGFLVMHNLHGRAQQGTVQIAQPRRGCASARVVVWRRLARRQGRGRGTCRATRNRHQ